MARLKAILDHKNALVITLFAFIVVTSLAIGLIVWLNFEPYTANATFFGGLSWFVSLSTLTILLDKVKLPE
jgi:magnesium-transporting ATPase (P-type)